MVIHGATCLLCIFVRDGFRARFDNELLSMESATGVQKFREVA
jgi:hypothetical protein